MGTLSSVAASVAVWKICRFTRVGRNQNQQLAPMLWPDKVDRGLASQPILNTTVDLVLGTEL
jgi:hypothetical protein